MILQQKARVDLRQVDVAMVPVAELAFADFLEDQQPHMGVAAVADDGVVEFAHLIAPPSSTWMKTSPL